MAETSMRINTDNGSPILNLAQDQLLTLLLLLPIDSILSFSMTCKRFRALTSSDTLWESICKRDWGITSIDAIKSTNNYPNQLSWMRMYKQVSTFDSVSCHKVSDLDTDLSLPSPRASHSLNFVSDCLILFGGGCEGGRHVDDTWVAYTGNNSLRMLQWQKIGTGIPSGRFGHTCVVIDNSLVLFGGINDRGDRQNDTWIGQVEASQGNYGDITLSWRLLDVGPNAPPPRGAHAACCVDNRKMVLHGGIGPCGVRLGDTWVLEISETLCFGTWYEIVTNLSPPPRSGHSLTCIGGTRTVLFGGRGLGYDVLSDVWFLDVSTHNGPSKWIQIHYDLRNIPEGASLPRVGHSATLILGGRLLIYGGEDSCRHRKDDFWTLDVNVNGNVDVLLSSNNTNEATMELKGSLRKMWKKLKAFGYKPKCRSFHRACVDSSGRYLYVFGGMVDGLLQPAGSTGLRFDREVFRVELMT